MATTILGEQGVSVGVTVDIELQIMLATIANTVVAHRVAHLLLVIHYGNSHRNLLVHSPVPIVLNADCRSRQHNVVRDKLK